MNEFSFEANYLITNGTDGPVKMIHFTYSAPGKKLIMAILIIHSLLSTTSYLQFLLCVLIQCSQINYDLQLISK